MLKLRLSLLIIVSWMLHVPSLAASDVLEVVVEVPGPIESRRPIWFNVSLFGLEDVVSEATPFKASHPTLSLILTRGEGGSASELTPFHLIPDWQTAQPPVELLYTDVVLNGRNSHTIRKLLNSWFGVLSPGHYELTMSVDLTVRREDTRFLVGEEVEGTSVSGPLGKDLVVWRLQEARTSFEVSEPPADQERQALDRIGDVVQRKGIRYLSTDDWCELALINTSATNEFLAEHLNKAPSVALNLFAYLLLHNTERDQALDQAHAWLEAGRSNVLYKVALNVYRLRGEPADAIRLAEFLDQPKQDRAKRVYYNIAQMLDKRLPAGISGRPLSEGDMALVHEWLKEIEPKSPQSKAMDSGLTPTTRPKTKTK